MKRTFTLISLCVLTLACKKGETLPLAEHSLRRSVTFSVSQLLQTNEPFSKAGAGISAQGDTLKNYAKYLYCRIYPVNSLHNYITLTQTPDSVNFGRISTKLTPGYYTVHFLASNQRLNTDQFTNRYTEFQFRRNELTYWEDLFSLTDYKLVVPDSNMRAEIRLQRLVGAIEVNLEDEIPANVAKITFDVTNDGISYHFSARVMDKTSSHKEFVLSESQKGKANQRFLIHILNNEAFPDMTLTLRAYDSVNTILAEKSVPIQRVHGNKKTALTGTLFSPSPQNTALLSSQLNRNGTSF